MPMPIRRRRVRRLSAGRRLSAAAGLPRRQAHPRGRDRVVSDAGLRGLGGAGFPTGRKWALVRAEPAPRLMAVNADEGEPGTFKDRYYLERDPHRFIEGMLIAAWVVEAAETYIYIRDEYPEISLMLQRGDRQGRGRRPFPPHQAASAARRRRLYLRRRIGDDRNRSRASAACRAIARPMWRRSACSAGRRSSRTSRRCSGCATFSTRASHGSPPTAAMSARACAASRSPAGSRIRA